MDKFAPATQGISNFVTAPDFIPTVLIRNADEAQLTAAMEACRESGKIYNVYCQTDTSDEEWIWRIERIADMIIDAQIQDPAPFFTK